MLVLDFMDMLALDFIDMLVLDFMDMLALDFIDMLVLDFMDMLALEFIDMPIYCSSSILGYEVQSKNTTNPETDGTGIVVTTFSYMQQSPISSTETTEHTNDRLF
ncbi:hypothetical protein BgiMline_015562 [Biomphalaria glabrata]|nr:hypothetical protein BgiMline_008388 [Biomphalaria glabrata]